MGQYHRIDLLVCNRRLIPTGIETAGIDFPGDLLGYYAIAGAGQQEDYGFFQFHNMQIYKILRNLAIY